MGFFPLEFFVGVGRGGNSGIFQVYIGGSVGVSSYIILRYDN